MNIKSSLVSLLAASALAFTAKATPISFDFKDPKGVNNVQFHLDAPLESISGSATGVTGTVSFDPANPAATTGKIVLSSKSLTVGNPLMQEHLLGADWINAAGFPEISFEVHNFSKIQTKGDRTDALVTGILTIKGVAKEVTVPVSLTYLPGKLGARLGKADLKGDLLVLRAAFSVNRSDYGIMAGKAIDKVSENVDLTLSLAGSAFLN